MAEPSPLSTVPPTVLVVDDEKNIRRTLEMVLTGEGYRVLEAESGEKALETLGNPHEPVDVAIFDLKLPGMSGLDALQRLRSDDATRDLPVIVVSGHATVHDAVAAIKLGATDFFEKPLNRERVLVSVRNSIRTARLNRTVEQLRVELEARYEMIGTSAPIQKLFQDVDKVAPTKANVLITGESGTGKELVSRAIHRLSPRRDAPFVKVNCAAIPRELIESELFGHEKGSFTGAQARKRGFFEQAHGGTLFLDEIGDMDLTAQAKVLRALQNGEVVRVGSEHVINVDVRVLAATNKDLAKAVQAGTFREDLFFRLDVFPIRVPALRERKVDIAILAEAFVSGFCKDNGLRSKRIDPSVFDALSRRKWPGNVRELKNVVERAAILSSDVITIADLPEDPHDSPFDDEAEDASATAASTHDSVPDAESTPLPQASSDRLTLREYRETTERAYIIDTLKALDWNISKAAIVLGVERTNLHKKVRSYGIKRGEG
ncbi:MAG TPA: sigma-54 dependent transcriptional regulator [Polyangiaceae bacterium]|nr:sigma-54 dependent transcriptional regulator [Polyangiaceae bacterium]